MTGDIPLSPALAEAEIDSLAILMSRDPEGLSNSDLSKIIQAYRVQRERWAAAEASGKTKAPSKAQALLSKTSKTLEDLGL